VVFRPRSSHLAANGWLCWLCSPNAASFSTVFLDSLVKVLDAQFQGLARAFHQLATDQDVA